VLENLLNVLARHPKSVLAAALAVLIGSLVAVRGLSVNDSPERWFPQSTIDAWTRYEQHFEYGDTIIVGLQFHRPVRDDDIDLLRSFRKAVGRIEGVASVTDASLIADAIEWVPLSELVAEPTPGRPDPFAIYRGALFDDPAVWRKPGDPDDGRTLLTLIELTDDIAGDTAGERKANLDAMRRRVAAEVFAVIDDHQTQDVTFHAASPIIIQHELEQIARGLAVKLMPPAVLLTLLALGIGFRSVWAVVIALVGGGWAVAVMLGGVALAGWTLNVLTVAGPILMAVVVIVTTVHFAHYCSVPSHSHDVTAADHELESELGPVAPRHPHEGRRHFVRWVAVPCLGAALTTGFGFLMLVFNDLRPARELGYELFFGSILAFLGAFCVWLLRPRFPAAHGTFLAAEKLEAFHAWVVRRPVPTIAILCLITLAAAAASSWMRIDADPFSFFEDDSRTAIALEHFEDRKFGHYLLDVILVPWPTERVQGEANQRKLQRLALAYEAEIARRPEVRNVVSTAAMREKIDQWQKRAVRAMAAGEWADGGRYMLRGVVLRQVFNSWLDDKQDAGTFRTTFMAYDPGQGFQPLMDAARAGVPHEQFDVFYAGTAASVAVLSEQLLGGITSGLVTGVICMGIVCVVLFRSARLTAIAFLPNAFPVLVVFGMMGLFGMPLNCGSAMVATIALGVALNDTVHFIMHYRGRRDEGFDVRPALVGTFGEIGRPIVLTSVVNTIGFGILFLSDFRPMSDFGLLASVAMVAALVGDLVMLPNLLLLFDRGDHPVAEPAATIKETLAT
jgi:predicted RND superfamily exporter protein